MDKDSPAEQSKQERLEQFLFVDIIRLAPEGAELFITTDPWHELPRMFGNRMVVFEGEWVVALNPSNREFLVHQALTYNVQDKLVHFYIVVENDRAILSSYDRMVAIELGTSFPNREILEEKYPSMFMA